MGHAAAVAQIEFLPQQAVGDHLVFRRRGDQKFAGGLVVGVIDHGQPLARQVGPVPAEEAALAVFVLERCGARSAGMPRYFTVNRRSSPAAGADGSVRSQAVGLVREADRGAGGGHSGTVMPLPSAAEARSSATSRDAVLDEAQGDGGLAGDLVVVVVEGDRERCSAARRCPAGAGNCRPRRAHTTRDRSAETCS